MRYPDDNSADTKDPPVHLKPPTMSTRLLIASLFSALLIGQGQARETQPRPVTRCGWFLQPTPANASLLDREAEWTISMQGMPPAEGRWPKFKTSQWVETNGHYGYGCACMNVVADSSTQEILVIKSARAQSLSVCRNDRSLKAPQ